MSKLNIDMIREIKNNHPAVPEPFLNESKLLDVEEDCRKAFLSSRTGRLGAFGKAFHSFIEAPSGDLVSAYILAIDSEDERKADVLLRFYTAPGERAVMRGAWPISTARIYFVCRPISPMRTLSIPPATTSRFWTIKTHT